MRTASPDHGEDGIVAALRASGMGTHRAPAQHDLITTAHAYAAAGFSLVPVRPDGSKAPAAFWKKYQSERAGRALVDEWFTGNRYDGLGVICGAVSGGLEMIELEGRAVVEGYLPKLTAALADHGLSEVWTRIIMGYLERSPSDGLHVLVKVDGKVRKNTKLARRPSTPDELAAWKAKEQLKVDKERDPAKQQTQQASLDKVTRGEQVPQVLIETRGEGGFVVTAPSGGRSHPSGKAWVMISGGIDTVATITSDERDALFTVASLLDEMPAPPAPPRTTGPRSVGGAADDLMPGTDYAQKTDWAEILEPHGWTCVSNYGKGRTWCRPGKSHSVSATTGTREGDNLFVFTTSTLFESEKPYTKLGAYAVLEHGGDSPAALSAAAKDLRAQGFGGERKQTRDDRHSTVGRAPQISTDGNLAVVHQLTPKESEVKLVPAPDNPMAVARHLTETSMVVDGLYTLRRYAGAWMRWDGPHWSEITDDAIRATLYPALEHATYKYVTPKGAIETAEWAPNRRKISDLAESLGAVTYLSEAIEIPSILSGPGNGPSGPGMDRADFDEFPQVDRVGPGGPGVSKEVPLENQREKAVHTESPLGQQWDFHPVHPVQPGQNSLSPAETLDRAPGPLPRSIDPMDVLACRNGLLNIRTRDLYALTPRFFNQVSVPFAYDETAPEPKEWLAFLADVWAEDPETVEALREWFGYILSGRTDQQKILFIVGPPRSGKGTIARVLTELIGAPNVASTTPATLPTDFGLMGLLGKSLAIMADARTPAQGNEELVEKLLTISGEDAVPVKRKYRDDWMGKLPTRFLLMSNDLPGFRDASGAIVSRLTILRMTKSNLGTEDKGLFGRLVLELPSILNWALVGLDRLNERGRFKEPASSDAARRALDDGASPIKAFLNERCVESPKARVPVAEIFEAWTQWCEVSNHKPGSPANLGKLLFSAAPNVVSTRPYVNGEKVRMYAGIRLRVPADDQDPDPSLCTACGLLMTLYGNGVTTHPSCEP